MVTHNFENILLLIMKFNTQYETLNYDINLIIIKP